MKNKLLIKVYWSWRVITISTVNKRIEYTVCNEFTFLRLSTWAGKQYVIQWNKKNKMIDDKFSFSNILVTIFYEKNIQNYIIIYKLNNIVGVEESAAWRILFWSQYWNVIGRTFPSIFVPTGEKSPTSKLHVDNSHRDPY